MLHEKIPDAQVRSFSQGCHCQLSHARAPADLVPLYSVYLRHGVSCVGLKHSRVAYREDELVGNPAENDNLLRHRVSTSDCFLRQENSWKVISVVINMGIMLCSTRLLYHGTVDY
jgi:hypothetical protein